MQDLLVPESKDGEALVYEPSVTSGIVLASGIVGAVAFNDKPLLKAGKVDNIATYRDLTSPFQGRQTPIPQESP